MAKVEEESKSKVYYSNFKVESEAFPEEERKKQKVAFKQHQTIINKILNTEEGFVKEKVAFRPLTAEDLAQVRDLHKEWFPLPYKDDFFERILQPNTLSEGCFYTLESQGEDEEKKGVRVVEEKKKVKGKIKVKSKKSLEQPVEKKKQEVIIATIMNKIKTNNLEINALCEEIGEPPQLSLEHRFVFLLSFIFYFFLLALISYFPATSPFKLHFGVAAPILMAVAASIAGSLATWKCEIRNFLKCRFFEMNQGAYIMTIGVIDECRRLGLASQLIDNTIKQVNELYPSCKVIYLHVVDYNQAAINFYKKKGFKHYCTLKNHYCIFDRFYNAELFYKDIRPGAKLMKEKEIKVT